MSIHLEWQYHGRELQVDVIADQTRQSLYKDLTDLPVYSEALDDLLNNSPFLVTRLFNGYTNGESELFNKAGKAIELIVKRNRIFCILKKLVSAAQDRDRTREISIDSGESFMPRMFVIAFQRHPEILTEATSAGKSEARETMLNILQVPEYPLQGWTKDLLLQKGLPAFPAIFGGEVASLPTKIPHVDLRYFYPNGGNMPTLSLVVKPFD